MTEENTLAGKRTRHDPRKEATRVTIIETAEALFAECGIDGVSLRQIGAAIGSANTSVVAYHFGSKEALVESIFHYRLPGIDARRGELMREAGDNVYLLLRALWLPLYEQVGSEGMHSYAGFMSALMHSDWGPARIAVNPAYPITEQLSQKIKMAMPIELQTTFDSRIVMTAIMVTGSLKMIDQANGSGIGESLFEDTLNMAAAALMAPVGS